MDYKEKYIKYKNKYIILKNKLGNMRGGVLLQDIPEKLIHASLGRDYNIPQIDEFEGLSWGKILHSKGNTLSYSTLLHISNNGLCKWYFENIVGYRHIIKEESRLTPILDDPTSDMYKKLQIFISKILDSDPNDVDVNDYKTKLPELGLKLTVIFDNQTLRDIGVAYHRLKIVLEKMNKISQGKDDIFQKEMVKLDKLLNILQTMLYNHIYDKIKMIGLKIFFKYPTNEDIEQNKLTVDSLYEKQEVDNALAIMKTFDGEVEEYNDELKYIVDSDPSFYSEPEYKIIISKIKKLTEEVPDDKILQFKLPVEFNFLE
jgi:hypothetical protein